MWQTRGLIGLCVLIAACSFDASKLRRSSRDAAVIAAVNDANTASGGDAAGGGPDLRPVADLPSPIGLSDSADLAGPLDLASAVGTGGASGTGGSSGSDTGGAGAFAEAGGGAEDAGSGTTTFDTGLDGAGPETAGLDASADVAADGGADDLPDAPVATSDSAVGMDGESEVAPTDSAVPVDVGNACPGHVAPIAYYPCESAAAGTLPDLSGNGNNATLVTSSFYGSGYSFVAGKVGSALAFSSYRNGHALLPARLLGNACGATIALWLYINSRSDWQRVFDLGVDQSTYMFLTTSTPSTNRMRFAITVSGYQNEQIVEASSAFPTWSWHHLAVVIGPGAGRIYLDGAEVGASTAITLRPSDVGGGSNNYVGRSQYSANPYLDGSIDELRIYDRALSAAEIQALMTGH